MKTSLFFLFSFAAQLFAADFAVPGTAGNSASQFPFVLDSMRYQQIYRADAFSSLTPVGGGWITAIQFRRSGTLPAGGATANFQIDFSTTSRAIDGLSTTFSDNVGSDARVAFGPGEINFQPAAPGPLGLAGPYITLMTPFFYNPAAGNLLMDVRMFRGVGAGPNPFDPIQFDASSFSDQTSRVAAFDRDSLTGNASTVALITGFSITPAAVPEPSSVVLLVAAAVVFSFFGLRKKQPHRKETRASAEGGFQNG